MSDLTRCNYCTLEAVKRRPENKGHKVTVAQTRDSEGWLVVHVDGVPIGISFLALTAHCAC
jgi:hypothetical protein